MENIGFGLQLLAVGMVTVFAILLIVIYGSKALIHIVNYIAPEEASAKKTKMAVQKNAAILTHDNSASDSTIDAQTMEILQKTISQLTAGKGHLSQAIKI